MKTFELTPVNGSKSFYGKCRVEQRDQILTLKSYDTNVAKYSKKTDSLIITKDKKHLTNTTLTHINAFLVYIGRNTMTKKEVLKNNL